MQSSEPVGKTVRINISLPDTMLDMLDKAAKQDYTTRSALIRVAVLWYLRPQGRDLEKADPEIIVKTLQRRKAKAELSQFLKENRDEIDI